MSKVKRITKKSMIFGVVLCIIMQLSVQLMVGAEAADTITFSDDFSSYGTGQMNTLGSNWVSNGKRGWGDDNTVSVISGSVSGLNTTWLQVESRAAWNSYGSFPGIRYAKTDMPMQSDQKMSFFMSKGNYMGGGGVRFLMHNSGNNFYELYFPRSEAGVTYQLSKTVNGVRTVLKNSSTAARLAAGPLYRVALETSTETGEISWTVVRNDGNPITDDLGTPLDISGDYTDSAPFEYTGHNVFELFGGGQGGYYMYFTDFSIEAVPYPTIPITEDEFYPDNFDSYNSTSPLLTGSNVYLNDNWKSYSGNMGYDGNAMFGISDSGGNKVLTLETRAAIWGYNLMPTVKYTGDYPSTKGFTVSYNLYVPYGSGGGIRFMMDEQEQNYYELYFPRIDADSAYDSLLHKVKYEGGVTTRTVLASTTGSFPSLSPGIIGGPLYKLTLKVCNGRITYSLSRNDGNPGFFANATATDTNNPYITGTLGLFGAGQGGQYMNIDNFSISSYDPYIHDQAEPTNVLYRDIAFEKQIKEHVIEFDKMSRVRKVIFSGVSGNINAEVSQDGENYFSIGKADASGGKATILNIVSGAYFKYIKVPIGAEVIVLEDVKDDIGANLYTSFALYLRLGGANIEEPTLLTSDYNAINPGINSFYIMNESQSKVKVTVNDGIAGGMSVNVNILDSIIIEGAGGVYNITIFVDKSTSINDSIGIISFYNQDKSLANCIIIEDTTVFLNSVTFSVNANLSAQSGKIMLWKELSSLTPISKYFEL